MTTCFGTATSCCAPPRPPLGPRLDGPAAIPNPKRLARQAAKAAREVGVSTASQEALRLAQEACRRQRQGRAREQREAEAEHKRELRRAKAKAKHRGR